MWDEAVGQDYLTRLGVTPDDFAALVSVSGLERHTFLIVFLRTLKVVCLFNLLNLIFCLMS